MSGHYTTQRTARKALDALEFNQAYTVTDRIGDEWKNYGPNWPGIFHNEWGQNVSVYELAQYYPLTIKETQ